MMRLITLYDQYIDQRKLTEQKKPVDHIVPPQLKGVGTINFNHASMIWL